MEERKRKGESAVRASWDEYFMEIAEIVKTRSTCLRRQVGAVIVKDNRIITTGYNGAPSGLRHCLEIGCERQRLGVPSGERHELCRALHAEQNAIIQAAKLGISTEGATIYITLQPCVICAKMLINAGIKKIVHKGEYPDELSRKMLDEAGIEIQVME
nr:dCMP deaminase family protein [Anaerotignum lactatifermentans]